MTCLSGHRDRSAEHLGVEIEVSEHEMRRPCDEHGDDFRGADVPAMDHGVDLQAFEHADRWPRMFQVAMCVADNAQTHDGDFVYKGILRTPSLELCCAN